MEMDELVNVRFGIDTPSYNHVGKNYSAFDDIKARTAFYREAEDIFLRLGWTVSGRTNVSMDDSFLYIHPKEIAGTVRMWEVDYIIDHLKRARLFSVGSVDIE